MNDPKSKNNTWLVPNVFMFINYQDVPSRAGGGGSMDEARINRCTFCM